MPPRHRMTGVNTAGSSGTGEGRTEGAPGGMEEEVPLQRMAARGEGGKAEEEAGGGSPGGGRAGSPGGGRSSFE